MIGFSNAILLMFLAAASLTDIRQQKIFNWTTYPGILVALITRSYVDGWPGAEDSFRGLAVCGGIMLFCFLALGIGGGDLKLIAMVGAFLGMEKGIEVLLWTFILGGAMGIAILIWELGLLQIVRGMLAHLGRIVAARNWIPVAPLDRKPLKRTIFLAPSAFLGTVLVLWNHQRAPWSWTFW